MKKLSVLFILAFVATTWQAFGQTKANQPGIQVTLGNIMPKYTPDGKYTITATRDELLANRTITMPPPPCEVIGFTFSMLPKGKDFQGPYEVTGATLTEKIVNMLKELEEPVGTRIFIEQIRLKCGNQEMKAHPIIMKLVAGNQ
jgi:hypothetical protein